MLVCLCSGTAKAGNLIDINLLCAYSKEELQTELDKVQAEIAELKTLRDECKVQLLIINTKILLMINHEINVETALIAPGVLITPSIPQELRAIEQY